MKSLANAEWAANEDSPATPSMAEDAGWMVWLNGVGMDGDAVDIWAPSDVPETV